MTPPGCTVGGCDRAHYGRGYCRPHYVRWSRHGDPRAEVPIRQRPAGGGSYWSAHRLVAAERGPASAQRCAECGAPAVGWSYDGTDPRERTDPSRGLRYSLDPARYRPRCASCRSGRGRGRAVEALDVERAARLYRAGASARGIGGLLGASPGVVRAALRAHGVIIRPSLRDRR
jgi:hypothetical protein